MSLLKHVLNCVERVSLFLIRSGLTVAELARVYCIGEL
jgi:hypothetical protein